MQSSSPLGGKERAGYMLAQWKHSQSSKPCQNEPIMSYFRTEICIIFFYLIWKLLGQKPWHRLNKNWQMGHYFSNATIPPHNLYRLICPCLEHKQQYLFVQYSTMYGTYVHLWSHFLLFFVKPDRTFFWPLTTATPHRTASHSSLFSGQPAR